MAEDCGINVDCDTCARAKVKSFGLSRKHLQPGSQSVQLAVLDSQISADSNLIVNVPTDELRAPMAAVVGTLPLSESTVSSIFDDDDDPY